MTNVASFSPSAENEVIFACDMTAIKPEQREEHLENVKELFGQVQTVEERADGYALQLPAESDTLLRAAQFIVLERLCCPFFGFKLELSPATKSFWLDLTGPEGVKSFIVGELGEFVAGSFGKLS